MTERNFEEIDNFREHYYVEHHHDSLDRDCDEEFILDEEEEDYLDEYDVSEEQEWHDFDPDC